MPLRLKLALSYLLIGLIPVLGMAFMVYQQAGAALREQTLNALEAVANIKQQQLLDNWQQRRNQIGTLASNLSNTYQGLDANALLSSANYDRPIFANFISTFGYRDLKLVLPDDTVMFSLLRGSDYQQQLTSSGLRDTPLAQLVKQSREQGRLMISDLLYNDLSQAPTQYLAAPIMADDELIMTLVLELPIAPLNTVMQTRQGLGEQGETYLVGSDSLLRSDSVRVPELQVSRNQQASAALPGSATEEIVNITHALQGSSSEALQTMQASAEQAHALERETQVVLGSLSQLDDSLQSVQAYAEQIASAADEQAGVTQEVNQHMHRLYDMTRDNRQTAAHTRSSGEHLQQVADSQQALVQRFQL